MFAGQEMDNEFVSATITEKLQVSILPAESDATNVFTVTPIGKAEPLAKPAIFET